MVFRLSLGSQSRRDPMFIEPGSQTPSKLRSGMFGSASRTLTMILAGDIGGTKTRIALFREAADQLAAPINQQSFPSQQYESLNAILKLYLSANSAEVKRACFGIAGPIVGGRVEPANLT